MRLKRLEEGPLIDELKHDLCMILNPRVSEFFFRVGCSIWLVYWVLATSFFSKYILESIFSVSLINYLVLLCLGICELGTILNRGYTHKDAYAFLVLILCAAGPLQRSSVLVLLAALLVFSARSFDVCKTIAFCSAIVALTVLIVMVCSGIGLIPDTVMDEPPRVRHCLGFLFFLNPSMYVFMLTCIACCLRGEDLSYIEGLLLLVGNFLMFRVTESQTSFGLSVGLVSIVLLLKLPFVKRMNLSWLWKVLSWSFLLGLVGSVVLTLVYGISHDLGFNVLDALDAATRGRFSYGYRGLRVFGVTSLGQVIPWQGNGLNAFGYNPHIAEYNYVDNMYVHLLIEQGLAYTLTLIGLCTGVTRKAYACNNHVLLLSLSAIAAYAVLNDLTMYLQYNLLLFLVADLFDSSGSRTYS